MTPSFITALRRSWPRWLGMGLLAWVLAACSSLPRDVERPVSSALAPSTQTTLSGITRSHMVQPPRRQVSGFLLLNGPQEAYGSRLALVQQAEKTLDLQYYAIHADASSERLLRGVVSAARRGVRVRILLDDFHSTGRNALVMRMAFEPRIEMRMFNPVAGPRGSTLGRLWGSLTDFSRVQQRMHNKLFLADNTMGVTGGRNLGDAYFGISEAANFVDMDVLAIGPIVQEMSRSFDAYWNNARAYPVQSLITPQELDQIRAQVLRDDTGPQQETLAGGTTVDTADASPAPRGPVPPDGEPRPSPSGATAAQRERVWNKQPMDLRAARFVWAPAAMLADEPTKIAHEEDTVAATTTPPSAVPDEAGPGAPPASDATATPSTAPAPRGVPTESTGDTVVDGLLQLIRDTREQLLIISPYFVPGTDMKAAFAAARARGVQVRILTNSLASNDAPIAHVGYARHREELLDMGIGLYEMRSEQAGLGSAFGSSGGSSTGASRSMLHSKVLVIDGRLLVIGSMNLDLRSQLQNTEIALLIRSRELSREASQQIDEAMRTSAWRLERQDGHLVWRAPEGSGLQDATTDPDSSLGLRLILKLLGPLAPDHLL